MSEQQEVLTKPVRLIDPVRCQLFDRITRLETSELCSRLLLSRCLVTKSGLTLCDPVDCSTQGFPVLYSLPQFAQAPCPLSWLCCFLLLLPFIFPSIRVFSSELALHLRWPKDWSFSFSISPCNGYSGLISFRTDWLDLLAVQGTLESLLQQPQFKSISSPALSFLYGPTFTFVHDYWKNHSFDCIWTFVGKVMSLLFDLLSRFVRAFLPRK